MVLGLGFPVAPSLNVGLVGARGVEDLSPAFQPRVPTPRPFSGRFFETSPQRMFQESLVPKLGHLSGGFFFVFFFPFRQGYRFFRRIDSCDAKHFWKRNGGPNVILRWPCCTPFRHPHTVLCKFFFRKECFDQGFGPYSQGIGYHSLPTVFCKKKPQDPSPADSRWL